MQVVWLTLTAGANPDATFRVTDGARMIHMPGPDPPETMSYLRILPEAECFELLAVASVGRVGFQSPSGVQIIPLNYRLGAGPQLFMKTAPGSAVAQLAEMDAPVAFEVDYHADDFQIAWSVLMSGTISRLDAAATAAYEELRRPPVPWAGPASSLPVRFVPRTVSGRGLHRTRPD
jgi:nitroimidazol reductase NimA-like FMN-containing flavoprotein (pyridoxamine 5'-phosphate oxidase superfamily)